MIDFKLIREDIIPESQDIPEFSFTSGERTVLALQILNIYSKKAKAFDSASWFCLIELPTIDSLVSIAKEGQISSCETDASVVSTVLTIDDTVTAISGIVSITLINKIDTKIIVPTISTLVMYDSITGFLKFDDSVILTDAKKGMIFIDSLLNKFLILSDASNIIGNKGFYLSPSLSPNLLLGSSIVKSINVLKASKKGVFNKRKLKSIC